MIALYIRLRSRNVPASEAYRLARAYASALLRRNVRNG